MRAELFLASATYDYPREAGYWRINTCKNEGEVKGNAEAADMTLSVFEGTGQFRDGCNTIFEREAPIPDIPSIRGVIVPLYDATMIPILTLFSRL